MNHWTVVKFTEARQVAELMRLGEESLPDHGITPGDHFGTMRAREERVDAVRFMGLALPRFEAVSWAAHLLESEARDRRLPSRDRQALDFALRWLGDPDDARRRAVFEAAETADDRSPERLLGLAVFFSGGSISLPDLPPVLPPPEAAGTFAGAAVLAAGFRTDRADALFDAALDLGEAVAARGLDALRSG